MARRYLSFTTAEWDELTDLEQLMYIDGMREEGILKEHDSDVIQLQPTEFGKPQQLGPRKITPDELSSRTVNIPKVNWEPPT